MFDMVPCNGIKKFLTEIVPSEKSNDQINSADWFDIRRPSNNQIRSDRYSDKR